MWFAVQRLKHNIFEMMEWENDHLNIYKELFCIPCMLHLSSWVSLIWFTFWWCDHYPQSRPREEQARFAMQSKKCSLFNWIMVPSAHVFVSSSNGWWLVWRGVVLRGRGGVGGCARVLILICEFLRIWILTWIRLSCKSSILPCSTVTAIYCTHVASSFRAPPGQRYNVCSRREMANLILFWMEYLSTSQGPS